MTKAMNPNSYACRFLWHRWTPWGVETMTARQYGSGQPLTVSVQSRKCERCGYQQVERLVP
jgi:hypothetical protein